jgi:hypothetical protein
VKKVVVTQAFGDKWKKIRELTEPRMKAYCERHGQDYISMEKPLAEPPQYTKSAIGNIMATRGYDVATFFDCDVLIAEDCDDIANEANVFSAFNEGIFLDRKNDMVKLAKTYGATIKPKFYVNTGVFVISSKVIGVLSLPPLGLFPNHFAEQTWMNIMLHLWDIPLPDLDPAFNCMTSVESHFGMDRYKDASIIHYAGQSADLDKLAKTIAEDDAKWKGMGR